MNQTGLQHNLDNINHKLTGYVFVQPVGFNHVFYFPSFSEIALTPSEYIFIREENFYINEKTHFNNHIRKLMTSNYYYHINNNSLFDEVFIYGNNTEGQYFTLNGEIYNFSI